MRKTKILILIIILLSISNVLFIYLFINKKTNINIEKTVNIEGPISMQVNDAPSFYKGITNILSFEIKNINQEDLIVKIDSSIIEYYPDYEFFEVKVFKTGRSKLELYYKEDKGDTIKIYDRIIFIRHLPNPIPHLALIDTIGRDHLIDIGRIVCYNSLNGRSEQTFEIVNQTMVATIDNIEREVNNSNRYFSIEQKEFIKKLKPGQHLIIKDIKAVLPDSTIRKLRPLIKIIKD